MWRELLSEDGNGYVGVFGVKYDGGASVGSGAALAPEVLRARSRWLPPFTCKGEQIPLGVVDLGDVQGFDADGVKKMLDRSMPLGFTLMLGGDHSVSILTEAEYRRRCGGRVGLIHVDAHADICDEYDGSKNSHACPCRRAIEGGYAPEDLTMIGIRSFERQEVEYLKDSEVKVYLADDVRDIGTTELVRQIAAYYEGYDSIYLSLDIDVLDPGFAPGTGTPESFGLFPVELRDILTGLIKALPVGMMDLVEISPPLDSNDVTVWAGLKLLLEVFKCISDKNCNFRGEKL